MARRRRQRKPKDSSDMIDELGGAETETLETEARPMTAEDTLAINLDYAAEAKAPSEDIAEGEGQGDAASVDVETEAEAIRTYIHETVSTALDSLQDEFARLDRRSRDRMNSVLAESSARSTSIEDAVEELQVAFGELVHRLDDLAARTERTEESCGLRPSLLTTAESAVAKLDAMAQEGSLRAEDIRAIHRKLRAATQEERARRQQ